MSHSSDFLKRVSEIALEIDPEIIDIGRRLHPSHPYADPRVIIHNTDARSFLEQTPLVVELVEQSAHTLCRA